jgi:hypothetical protein
MPKERLARLLLAHARDLWAVDGLYFLAIERSHGTEEAVAMDREVWEAMGAIEARRLRRALGIEGGGVGAVLSALRCTTWMLDLEGAEVEEAEGRAVVRATDCRIQRARREKCLVELPCKEVRWGYLRSFARELDPSVEVRCLRCPPDERGPSEWCAWELAQRVRLKNAPRRGPRRARR